MGGAVSSGRDNDELIDNLRGGNYIQTPEVERVFRALDRADYMTPNSRDQAYKDQAWRYGYLHMSSPCIYSEVMEGLNLKPGLSFLNVGSGTGYLSTLVGLILGSSGINHGVEVHPFVVDYANTKLGQFLENSDVLDEFDFCEPKFYSGNGLCLAPLQTPYDRVYCGAGCPEEYQNYFKQLIKVGGILVMPLNESLLQLKRISSDEWVSHTLLNVSFATLRSPTQEETEEHIRLEEQKPPRLQVLSRSVIRGCMRGAMLRRHPALRSPPPAPRPKPRARPRRICIPVEDETDIEGLEALHELPRERGSGAHEMNALLSLVLSMGHNRVAGAIRIDRSDSLADASSDEDNDDAGDEATEHSELDDDRPVDLSGRPADATRAQARANESRRAIEVLYSRPDRGVISFEVRDSQNRTSPRDLSDSSCDTKEVQTDEQTTSGEQLSQDRSENGNEASTSSEGKTRNRSDIPDKSNPKVDDNDSQFDAEDDDDDDDDQKPDEDGDLLPAEVEICFGKESTSADAMELDLETDREDDTEVSDRKMKRQKFDSGLGEENSPSTSASSELGKTRESEMSDTSVRSDTFSLEEIDEDDVKRSLKRARLSVSGESSSSTEDVMAAHVRRRARRLAESASARRAALALHMKRAIKELPLPTPLKKYVNLGRCFQI